jgi:transcriptional regulator with XRE-family HTH domain
VTDLRGQLAVRVKQFRQARRLTQEQVAERAGLSSKFIGEIERGRANPALTTLASIADALGVNLVDLIASDGDRTSRLSARQITQVREALASIETLVELAAPPEQPRKARKK